MNTIIIPHGSNLTKTLAHIIFTMLITSRSYKTNTRNFNDIHVYNKKQFITDNLTDYITNNIV